MFIRCAIVAAAVVVAAPAQGALMAHELTHVVQQTAGGVQLAALSPAIFVFDAADFGMTTETLADGSVVTNPLYKDKGMSGQNPLYEAGSSSSGALRIQDIEFIEFTFSEVAWHLKSEGIIHRDIAARNILLRTTQGDYTSGNNENWNFGSDAGYRADVGPIRWMAPESMRLYLNGVRSDDYIDIHVGAFFDAMVIPAPASALPLAIGALALRRRR